MTTVVTDLSPSVAERSRPCAATTSAGLRCRGAALPGNGFCFAHDPGLARRRGEARERGGRNSSRTARARALMPATLVAVLLRLEKALERLDAGRMDPRRASAMAAVSGAIVRVWEAGILEGRLNRIEELLAGLPAPPASTRAGSGPWQ